MQAGALLDYGGGAARQVVSASVYGGCGAGTGFDRLGAGAADSIPLSELADRVTEADCAHREAVARGDHHGAQMWRGIAEDLAEEYEAAGGELSDLYDDDSTTEDGTDCPACHGYGTEDGAPAGTFARDFGPGAVGPCPECLGSGYRLPLVGVSRVG
jgi:hypothetical protein